MYSVGEHQYELMDFVAAKFYEESGVFKLLVGFTIKMIVYIMMLCKTHIRVL